MSDAISPEETQPREDGPWPQGHPLLAWCVILGVVGLVIALQQQRPDAQPVKESADRLQRKASEQQARWTVGLKELVPGDASQSIKETYRQQVDALDRGPYRQRLEAAVLAGELLGPKEALTRLDRLEDEPSPSVKERRVRESLRRLYTEYSKDNYTDNVLSDKEKEEIREELGWLGELALAPAKGPHPEVRAAVVGPARRLVIVLSVGILTGLGLVVLGFIGLVVLLVLLFNGRLTRRFIPGSRYGGIYAETFAVWLILFIALTLLAEFLPTGRSRVLMIALFSLLSLAALAWPVWRGVPWEQVRLDVGLYGGGGPVREA